MQGYQLTVENAMRFFQLCHQLELKTEVERLTLLEAMQEEGLAVGLTRDDIVRRIAGKKVLRVKAEDK